MRDLIIEHNCRFEDSGKLHNDGDVVITKSEDCDDGHFEDAFTPYSNGVCVGDPDIKPEHPVTWDRYGGEVELPIEGGETEWFSITFDKTYIRTNKTDEELIAMIPVIDATQRLLQPTY